MKEDIYTRERDPATPSSPPASSAPRTPAGPSPDGSGRSGGGGERSAGSELRFAAALAFLGALTIVLTGALLLLPLLLSSPPGMWILSYAIASLCGPVGVSMLSAALRTRNRAVHGTEVVPAQRRLARYIGAGLCAAGLCVMAAGLAAPGFLAMVLGLVWGFSILTMGLRTILRSLVSGSP